MIVKIIKHYGTRDLEQSGGFSTELVLNGETKLFGDQYHDKIREKIEGYLQALKDINYQFEIKEDFENDLPEWDS